MAIQWGAWEYSGGNGIRVGIEIEGWTEGDGSGDVNHGSAQAQTWVAYYTENQYSYNDGQSLNLNGAIDATVNFTNNQGGAVTQRARKLFEYDYGPNEYGSSPGNRTFSATLSGAFNGVTPSKSVTVSIPARPYDVPAAPTNVSVSRVSDTSHKVTWTNKSTSGEPWDRVQVDRSVNGGAYATLTNTSGSATSFTDNTTSANAKYQYRVRAENSVGVSVFVYTSTVYTTPAAPTNAVRTGNNGANQTITWENRAGYAEYETQIVYYQDDGPEAQAGLVAAGETSFVHTLPASNPSSKFKYQVRHRNLGTTYLWSPYSNMTTETTGLTSAPNAPTNLSPTGVSLPPTQSKVFTWRHNPTDESPQTAYQIRWRVVGAATWNTRTKTTSSVSSWTAPANMFTADSNIEWQVATWGASTTGSAFSTSATFTTTSDPNITRAAQRVVALDLDAGEQVALGVNVLPPVGALMPFAGAAAPSGWLVCQGQAVSRTTYADLFAVIGTTFGAGDGSTTFNVPNLQDRAPVGASGTKARGTTGGDDEVTLGVNNMPPHNHGETGDHTHGVIRGSTTGAGANAVARGNVDSTGDGTTRSGGAHTHATEGGGEAFSVQNPYVALHYIIKV